MERQQQQRQPGGLVVGLTLVMIAGIAVWAARGTQRQQPAVTVTDEQPSSLVDHRSRSKAAHRLTCETIGRAIAEPMVSDVAFTIEEDADGTSRLMTAALLSGRRVDVNAVLRWHLDRGEWELLEARIGGAALLVTGRRD